MRRIVVYVGGGSYPADRHIETVIAGLFADQRTRFIGHIEAVRLAGLSVGDAAIEPLVLGLARTLPALEADQELILVGRSAGARVVSLAATRRPATAVVCLGYPFRSPSLVLEPERFAHLARLAVPTLIIQGLEDEYGGPEITEAYAFSPAIGLHFFEGGHDFDLAAPPCAHIPRLVQDFADGGWRRPHHPGMAFDEAYYLARNPGVARRVAEGSLMSGEQHFHLSGRSEGRRFRLYRKDPAQQ